MKTVKAAMIHFQVLVNVRTGHPQSPYVKEPREISVSVDESNTLEEIHQFLQEKGANITRVVFDNSNAPEKPDIVGISGGPVN